MARARRAGGAGREPARERATIQSVTPTVCALMGIEPPRICEAPPLDAAVSVARATAGKKPITRCLIYAPDAVGEHLLKIDPSFFDPLLRVASVRARLRSVHPPKTPVCFASMFTGAAPEAHGIRRYERPLLRADTLFDALVRAGKKVAIVAVADCSIDIIFRERPIDYFSEKYDPEVTARALALIEGNRHDLVLAYHQAYDDLLHASGPSAPRAFLAARAHVDAFVGLCSATDSHWAAHSRVVVFAPDHGAHRDPVTGRGDHGDDSPEDMEVGHFYGIRAGAPPRVG
jgi:hypothetical protein